MSSSSNPSVATARLAGTTMAVAAVSPGMASVTAFLTRFFLLTGADRVGGGLM